MINSVSHWKIFWDFWKTVSGTIRMWYTDISFSAVANIFYIPRCQKCYCHLPYLVKNNPIVKIKWLHLVISTYQGSTSMLKYIEFLHKIQKLKVKSGEFIHKSMITLQKHMYTV